MYALGDVMGIYKTASEAISQADNLVGLVFGINQHLIWGVVLQNQAIK